MGVSVLSALVATRPTSSWKDVGDARQANIVSEQQELVSLVSAIAQSPEVQDQEAGTFNGNESAEKDANLGIEFTELTDSEEADYLIGLLHGVGVTAIEYYQIAVGLEASESSPAPWLFSGLQYTWRPQRTTIRARSLNAWIMEAGIDYDQENKPGYTRAIPNAKNAFAPLVRCAGERPVRGISSTSSCMTLTTRRRPITARSADRERRQALDLLGTLAPSDSAPSDSDEVISANLQKTCPNAG